jgi:hypothetical protein
VQRATPGDGLVHATRKTSPRPVMQCRSDEKAKIEAAIKEAEDAPSRGRQGGHRSGKVEADRGLWHGGAEDLRRRLRQGGQAAQGGSRAAPQRR